MIDKFMAIDSNMFLYGYCAYVLVFLALFWYLTKEIHENQKNTAKNFPKNLTKDEIFALKFSDNQQYFVYFYLLYLIEQGKIILTEYRDSVYAENTLSEDNNFELAFKKNIEKQKIDIIPIKRLLTIKIPDFDELVYEISSKRKILEYTTMECALGLIAFLLGTVPILLLRIVLDFEAPQTYFALIPLFGMILIAGIGICSTRAKKIRVSSKELADECFYKVLYPRQDLKTPYKKLLMLKCNQIIGKKEEEVYTPLYVAIEEDIEREKIARSKSDNKINYINISGIDPDTNKKIVSGKKYYEKIFFKDKKDS